MRYRYENGPVRRASSFAFVFAVFTFLMGANSHSGRAEAAQRVAAPSVPVMYVSDFRDATVSVFRIADGRKVGFIPYPMAPGGKKFATGVGLGTDAANNLWASFAFDNGRNFPGKIVIYGYAPGQSHWFTTIRGGCCGSPNLAVTGDGEIAEALGYFPPDYGGGVGFVEPGKRYVGRFNGGLLGAIYDAYDSTGTLWVGGVDAGFRDHIGFIRRGNFAFEEVLLNPAPRLGPIAVDASSYLLVDNDAAVYAYNRRGALVYRVSLEGAVRVAAIVLSHDGRTLYVAKKSGTVLAYAFPRGGKPLASYAVGGTPYAITLGEI